MTDQARPESGQTGSRPVDSAARVSGPVAYLAQVRWSDPDIMGHVNHARYLSYFEDARMALLERSPTGVPGMPGHRGCIAARVAVDYLAQVTFRPGLMLRVDTSVARIGTSSWTLRQQLYVDGPDPVARCECVLVTYDYAAQKPRPLDDDERAYWSAL